MSHTSRKKNFLQKGIGRLVFFLTPFMLVVFFVTLAFNSLNAAEEPDSKPDVPGHIFVPHHGGPHGDYMPDIAAHATIIVSESGSWSELVGTTSENDVVLIEEGATVTYDIKNALCYQVLL